MTDNVSYIEPNDGHIFSYIEPNDGHIFLYETLFLI